jgi:hypothetical protein
MVLPMKCIVTDAAQATFEGLHQKLVLLTIKNIAKDGTLNITLTA